MKIIPIACLKDNYAYLVVCETTGVAAIVDPSESTPVVAAVERAGVRIDSLWATHHHWDHTAALAELAPRYDAPVLGHESDRGRIAGQTKFLADGDLFLLGALSVRVLHVPGHTLGAIAYVVSKQGAPSAVFTGDTLFIAGCGRLFEGTADQMLRSLTTLASLPADTRVYCGHEYTAANLRFAAHVEPSNDSVAAAAVRTAKLRNDGQPSVPSLMAHELEINPFLRSGSRDIRRSVGLTDAADPVEVFAAVRKAKDTW